MKANYQQISKNLLDTISEKPRAVLARRFGLGKPYGEAEKETLDKIGRDFGITRERVRQIERDAFLKLENSIKKHASLYENFKSAIACAGGVKREDALLRELGGEKDKNQIFFLLSLSKELRRRKESEAFHASWVLSSQSFGVVEKAVEAASEILKKSGKPMPVKDLNVLNLDESHAQSYFDVSKNIQRTKNGLWGLGEWPEVNPRGIKDRAYLAFKEENKPLHFMDVASLISPALPQTVHNELIKDSRFVLVGRGIYALREWGYESGCVRDVITKVLKEAGRPLDKEEIMKNVLKQRMVKENTILLNLSNRKYFSKGDGFYTPKNQEA